MIKKSFADFGISFDIYSRTTSDTHSKVASDFFKKLYEEGKLIEKTSMQYYDEEAHQFLADRYITGECPHCHNPKAYGDQCEKCGSDLDPTELINPKSAISGSQPVLKETKTGICRSMSIRTGSSSGYSKDTRSGAPTSTDSASHGSTSTCSRAP